MGRELRANEPGQWVHVMNRGLAKRAMFESVHDMRVFQSLLARVVRDRLIEVHAFALMLNHYHLLARSEGSRLSEAMRLVQGNYSRWFNETRDRDGPLVRGRFLSRPIDGDRHWTTIVRYIDANPVAGGISKTASEYAQCSAYWYHREVGPAWLSRSRVESFVIEASSRSSYDPAEYETAFPAPMDGSLSWWVERGLAEREHASISFAEASPKDTRSWLLDNLRRADGRERLHVIVAPGPLLARINAARPAEREAELRVISAGLLRTTCALRTTEIAKRLRVSTSMVSRAVQEHCHRLESDANYLDRVEQLIREASADVFA